MKIDDIARQSLLYDFYGALLTERQRQVMELYHEENLSLAEIADEFGISRQGVHDALHKAEKSLEDYEEKLKLVEKFDRTRSAIGEIDRQLDEISGKLQSGAVTTEEAAREIGIIRRIIDRLEE